MPGETRNERTNSASLTDGVTAAAATGIDPSGGERSRRRDKPDEATYYDISMLKPPVWTWEVAAYFFLGGLSAGSYILARLAERCGGEEYRAVTRAGTAVAALAILPCPPLLILDLGDRSRFHHMLRIWKPKSPMNLGSWTLTAYNGVLALAALREWWRDRSIRPDAGGEVRQCGVSRAGEALALVTDAAGIPVALLLAGYTGVLLSTTAAPVWSKNRWLGALFSASAMSTGSAAIGLVLEVAHDPAEPETPAQTALQQIDTAARTAEAAALAGYLKTAGKLAEPLTRGKLAPLLWGGVVGGALTVPELLAHLPARGKLRRWLKIAASLIALCGGLALRWSVLTAGALSANDPDAARAASRAQDEQDAV